MQTHTIECDLLVAGGGMAGVVAAIAAARDGLKVVLVQDRSVLGGNASSEIRMHICGADVHGSRKGWRESGIMEEIRLEDAYRNPERCYPFWDVLLYEKVIAEPNITLLLDTDIVGAEAEHEASKPALPVRSERLYEFTGSKGRIKSARAVRQLTEDEFIIKAKFYADCTGDGRLGFEAGADFRIGRESKAMHGETLAQEQDDYATLGNSILLTSRKTDHPVPFVAPPWARKFNPELLKVGRGINSWEYGFWWIEWGGHLDTIKDNLTTIRHELYGIALGLWDYVKNSGLFPTSENWTLDWIGAIPGKRESRRFLGEHILTEQDVLQTRKFEDECAYGGWAIDLHPIKGIDAIEEPPYTPTHVPNVYGIPLRTLFSRNIENLFFAGRDISATHVAFASTRVMATCAVGGEAIGHAAAYCVKNSLTPSKLVKDSKHLKSYQQHLLKTDCTLPYVPADVNIIKQATLTASSGQSTAELVRDGVTRDQLEPKTGELIKGHGWRSDALADGKTHSLEFTFAKPVKISELHLVFDTGFQRELTLSPSDWASGRQKKGAQPETVRDYSISINGDAAIQVKGNYQRKRVHKIASDTVSKIRVEVSATNGVPEARILEISAY